MNFLAHLALSRGDADLQVGNYIGDFIRGREMLLLPRSIQWGVRMHRDIDALTDADPDVRMLNKTVAQRHGRYAPVITDIVFDHALYRNWAKFTCISYPDFKTEAYAVLRARASVLPERIQPPLYGMTDGDWLQQYASPLGMASVFRRLRGRLSRPEYLDGIDATLRDLDAEINQVFLRVFPRLQTLAETYLERTPTD
jgi:acyl carrier protein phosphodiesterase